MGLFKSISKGVGNFIQGVWKQFFRKPWEHAKKIFASDAFKIISLVASVVTFGMALAAGVAAGAAQTAMGLGGKLLTGGKVFLQGLIPQGVQDVATAGGSAIKGALGIGETATAAVDLTAATADVGKAVSGTNELSTLGKTGELLRAPPKVQPGSVASEAGGWADKLNTAAGQTPTDMNKAGGLLKEATTSISSATRADPTIGGAYQTPTPTTSSVTDPMKTIGRRIPTAAEVGEKATTVWDKTKAGAGKVGKAVDSDKGELLLAAGEILGGWARGQGEKEAVKEDWKQMRRERERIDSIWRNYEIPEDLFDMSVSENLQKRQRVLTQNVSRYTPTLQRIDQAGGPPSAPAAPASPEPM